MNSFLNRFACLTSLALLLVGATTGCEAATDEDIASADSALTISNGANYVTYSYQTLCTAGTSTCVTTNWMKCGPNQVAVGLHKANQQVICADLPWGITPQNDANLEVPGNSHQILGMQSCAAGKYAWAIATSGSNSWLYCRSYSGLNWNNSDTNPNNNAFSDNGTNSSTSQSGPVYNLYPNAHVCKAAAINGGYNVSAMIGVHLSDNTFACAY